MTDTSDSRYARVFGDTPRNTPSRLGEDELWWAERHQWFKDNGYELRQRYAPDWIPSWRDSKKPFYHCEDGYPMLDTRLLDAVRLSDGQFVMLKMIFESRHPHEVEIGQYLSSEPLASDPANHCVPLYEVLRVPHDDADDDIRLILVMPLLRTFDDPPFDTVGEVLDLCGQVFDGLKFMHDHHVAHRDCSELNIMMDATPMFIGGWHPVQRSTKRDFSGDVNYYTRTKRPPRYYYIDFGISRRYDASVSDPKEEVIEGGDKSVPEHQPNCPPQNPFRTDIYCVGNVIKERFLMETRGLEFLTPLVEDMRQSDPTKRPTADEVVERFDNLVNGLSFWKLRSRVVYNTDGMFTNVFRGMVHWSRRLRFVVTQTPSIPKPSPLVVIE
ncbi:hypothetical protein CONPUDRAFT_102207 [Coniophora puteana RWD-64-598 SS2]|uniref:Protein kinase domain-containing protein n=1 Tax=Coniophora puteana (strain RWD-64-598) TaxID=741705 RepID=A0A5M3MXD1_CONPW|nr:uncharacterized protein CONPUDRAFT_102207 [Coniophora puteana RWD-64-598 SS2]EIW83434.1 hypothetical protein CONPUDRAFT_102207 [Coniophora puteana RWD-64-598 SS2]